MVGPGLVPPRRPPSHLPRPRRGAPRPRSPGGNQWGEAGGGGDASGRWLRTRAGSRAGWAACACLVRPCRGRPGAPTALSVSRWRRASVPAGCRSESHFPRAFRRPGPILNDPRRPDRDAGPSARRTREPTLASRRHGGRWKLADEGRRRRRRRRRRRHRRCRRGRRACFHNAADSVRNTEIFRRVGQLGLPSRRTARAAPGCAFTTLSALWRCDCFQRCENTPPLGVVLSQH